MDYRLDSLNGYNIIDTGHHQCLHDLPPKFPISSLALLC